MNLIDFNKISQIPHIQPKNVYTLESCSHGGIFSTENHLKVKIDFSSNINPLGISGQVLKEIRKSLTAISHIYPDPDCCLLRKGIADYIQHGIDPDWINVGNGATELIHTFVRAVSLKNSIILSPTFCEYELASKRCGMKIENISLSRRFEIEPDLIIEKSKIKPKNLIFICNPNNPTGLVETERIEKIICSANPSTILFIDESFIEFLENVEKKSLVSKIKEFDNVAILRSMTKAYGLAGLRLGYLVANPKIIQKLKKNQIYWNVNGIAQIAGVAALNDQDHLIRAKKMIQKERGYMYKKINKKKNDVAALKSSVNFFLIKLKHINSTIYQRIMLNFHGILVRDCNSFTGLTGNFIRVAVRKHKDNLKLINAIHEIDTNFNKYELLKNKLL